MKTVFLDLVCDLDDDELRARGEQLSATALEYDKVEADKKEATKGFVEELKALRGKIRSLSGVIRKHQEVRPVACVVDFDVPSRGIKRIARVDTGEFVRDEPMTAEESQRQINFVQ